MVTSVPTGFVYLAGLVLQNSGVYYAVLLFVDRLARKKKAFVTIIVCSGFLINILSFIQ